MTSAKKRLEAELLKDRIEAEVRLAHELMKAFPELSYVEAMRHAFIKIRKEQAKG